MIPEKAELALSIDEAEWSWLRAHLERGGLVLVDDSLDLVEAAMKVAVDDTRTVQNWIDCGKIGKPSMSQIHRWDDDRQKKFSMLIVSPYVLIQERMPSFH